jgi:reactive intermediate/imine deaminase
LVLSGGVALAGTSSNGVVFYPIPGSATPGSPASGLPLSEGSRVDDVLYLSGQIGNVQPGTPVVAGGVPAEAKQAMDNVKTALANRRLTTANVFKCEVFITDMTQLGNFNSVYAKYFAPGRLPARSAVGVSTLTLGAHVEVECEAIFAGSGRH